MLTSSKLYLLFAFLGIALFPIYLFPSGSVQISHALLILPAMFMLLHPQPIRRENVLFAAAFIWLLLWIWVRQSFYSLQTQQLEFMPALFILFNAIIAYFIVNLIHRYKLSAVKVIYYAILLAIVIALAFALRSGSSFTVEDGSIKYRDTGSFNNPNQLGYFSVCAAGILIILWAKFRMNTFLFYSGFAACLLIAIISLSKAAMLGIVVYLAVFVSSANRYKIVGYLGVIIALGILLTVDLSDYKFFYRLSSMGSENDGLMTRGYTLLFDMNWSLIYGEGKGYAKSLVGFGKEFHSTFGSILLSYGLLGFLPAIYLFWKLFSRLTTTYSILFAGALLLPIFAYGLTHNGIRATMAWIFLATCYAAVNMPKRV